MIAPHARSLREAVAAKLELRTLEAEDEYSGAIRETRVALHALRLLSLLEAHNAAVAGADERVDAIAAVAFAQLHEDVIEALKAQSAPAIERVATAVGEELAVRGARGAEDGKGRGARDEGRGRWSLLVSEAHF